MNLASTYNLGRILKDEGIVIAKRDFSDADRIFVIFTRSRGKASFIAKGVRKPKSRKRGLLETGNVITFAYADSRSIPIITEVELIKSHAGLRKSLTKISVAYFLCESVGRVTEEHEQNGAVYELLLNTFQNLENTTKLKSLRYKFIHNLLVAQGFWPAGRQLLEPDMAIEAVVERKLWSLRVGKRLQR